ncbi:MAG: MBL fold metallo-hydrolase [Deltaproteobacteria bacterium]|nr:MBL fold metallo-hydrolase [Nannocystaceae bacterium]
MKLHSVAGNTQRLDGGAMFGNAPRAVWQRWCAPDDHNRIELACRCLLIREDDGRTVLLETGIGAFFEPAMRERFGVVEDRHVLLDSLAALGVAPEQVDVVVLSHMHFDHAGGLLAPWREGAAPELVFPRAHYVVGREAWARALQPHARDRASFIPALQPLLEATGRLEIVDGDRSDVLGDRYSFTRSHGHTPGLLLTRVETPHGPITFMGDLIPGAPWVHLPITMGYDRYPELLIDEKHAVLDRVRSEHGWLFFTHDANVAAAKVEVDAKGRYHAAEPVAELAWS